MPPAMELAQIAPATNQATFDPFGRDIPIPPRCLIFRCWGD
jgi:hypothetical protein